MIKEGLAEIYDEKFGLTRGSEVFYNPQMKLARDVCVWILKKLKPRSMLDATAGSGVRAVRLALESGIKDITANDINPEAVKVIRKNAENNSVDLEIVNEDANVVMLKNKFDYIDIDPFGSPVYFLDSAVKSLKRGGILALTATDIAVLNGIYPKTCKRRYGAKPLNNFFRNEIGVRILIAKAQKVAAQYDKVLEPMFVHASNYYFRIYLKMRNSVKAADDVLNNQGYMHFCNRCYSYSVAKYPEDKICCSRRMDVAGKLWLGKLWDETLVDGFDLIRHVSEEYQIKAVGYYDMHAIAKKFKVKQVPKIQEVIDNLESEGYKASRTHLSDNGIRTDAGIETLRRFI